MMDAEHVQWEVTVMVVAGFKEPFGLVAIHFYTGTIKIQHGLSERFAMLLDKMIPQQFVGFNHRLSVHLPFHQTLR